MHYPSHPPASNIDNPPSLPSAVSPLRGHHNKRCHRLLLPHCCRPASRRCCHHSCHSQPHFHTHSTPTCQDPAAPGAAIVSPLAPPGPPPPPPAAALLPPPAAIAATIAAINNHTLQITHSPAKTLLRQVPGSSAPLHPRPTAVACCCRIAAGPGRHCNHHCRSQHHFHTHSTPARNVLCQVQV
jgi:hypothetical protein